MLHLCSIKEIFAHFNHQFKDRPECAQAIQNKTHELLENLLEYFESEDKPQDILLTYLGDGCWIHKTHTSKEYGIARIQYGCIK